jgi:hypothetical protein
VIISHCISRKKNKKQKRTFLRSFLPPLKYDLLLIMIIISSYPRRLGGIRWTRSSRRCDERFNLNENFTTRRRKLKRDDEEEEGKFGKKRRRSISMRAYLHSVTDEVDEHLRDANGIGNHIRRQIRMQHRKKPNVFLRRDRRTAMNRLTVRKKTIKTSSFCFFFS